VSQRIADTWPPECTARAADPRSDFANAVRLARHCGDRLLYVYGIGWHTWEGEGGPWRPDDLGARRIAAELGRIVANEAAEAAQRAAAAPDADARERLQKGADALFSWARLSEMTARIEAALSLASALLAIKPERLDHDPLLLGCPNGVLDLRTGRLRQHRRGDFITKRAGAVYDGKATAPTWSRFLARIFRQRPEAIAYMQRLAGYWLTGCTDPALLAVLWGGGANGKSTLVATIRATLGEYATAAPPSFLIARSGEAHPTELALLLGMRWIVASESGEGGRLDEERVKLLTGGDTITARRMRQDFFEFAPTHKLALQTNHRPIIRGTDEGIWRRIALIEFAETIPPEERDPRLADKLRAELPGVLAWAAEGCRAYLRDGLQPPAIVQAATAAYRSDSDAVGAFIAEECVELPTFTCAAGDLYAAYAAWADDAGERPMSKRALGLRLQERGFTAHKGTAGQRRWHGITLRGASGASDRFSGSSYAKRKF
jgi:putative DNA primase/helicase